MTVSTNQPAVETTEPSEAPHARPRNPRRARAWLGSVAFCAIVAVGWTFRGPWFTANLAVVDPGRVIRAAQPGQALGSWIESYRLRSVLNLRGGGPRDWWYANEVAETKKHGVALYDFPMNASRRPTRRELLTLIDLLQHAEYPLLIHCKSGADRTGLATALYRMVARGEAPDQAENAFSIEFGHVALLGPEHLHEPLHEYSAWLKQHRLDHTAARFREWVKNDYESPDPRVDPPPLAPGPRARHDRAQD